jgi:hypothetical protein
MFDVKTSSILLVIILGSLFGCGSEPANQPDVLGQDTNVWDMHVADVSGDPPDSELDVEVDEGLWPSVLPDCRVQIPYKENAEFEVPSGSPGLTYTYEDLLARELGPKTYTIEAAVVENGVAHNAFTQVGQPVKIGLNFSYSYPYDFDFRILVMRNFEPIHSTITRASTQSTTEGFWHIAPIQKAESMEITVPGLDTSEVSEIELVIWANPKTNLAGGFRSVIKITHYNEVVAPHPAPCLIPAAQGQFTEEELKYIVIPQTRLSVDHPDFVFPHWTNEFWPKLKIPRGESLDFLITSGRPTVPLRMGAQVLFVAEKVEWLESHGVELPITPPETFVATFRHRKKITFDEPGTYRFFAIQVADPFIPTHNAKNEFIEGYLPHSQDTSNVVEVIVE